jgi:hypothetical protein
MSTHAALLSLTRRPVAVLLRLVLWPAALLGLSHLVAGTEDDALAAGLSGFFVLVVLAGLLSAADGLVLAVRPLVLVWSVTTLVVVGISVAQPLADAFSSGPERVTWDYAVHATLVDLPLSLVFFLVLLGGPALVGALTGHLVARAMRPSPAPGQTGRPDGVRAG